MDLSSKITRIYPLSTEILKSLPIVSLDTPKALSFVKSKLFNS